VQAHPQKFRFVENLGKISENVGKTSKNPDKIPENLSKNGDQWLQKNTLRPLFQVFFF